MTPNSKQLLTLLTTLHISASNQEDPKPALKELAKKGNFPKEKSEELLQAIEIHFSQAIALQKVGLLSYKDFESLRKEEMSGNLPEGYKTLIQKVRKETTHPLLYQIGQITAPFQAAFQTTCKDSQVKTHVQSLGKSLQKDGERFKEALAADPTIQKGVQKIRNLFPKKE